MTISVFYDLEGAGLWKTNPEILQIGAVAGDRTYSRYITPLRPIEEGASRVNGLTRHGGQLFKDGNFVQSIPLRDALVEFYNFLSTLGDNCILVAHNGDEYDHKMLVRDLKNENLKKLFDNVVIGYADSIKIFMDHYRTSSKFNLGLPTLAKRHFGENVSHDALSDSLQLQRLVRKFDFSDHLIQSFSGGW